MVARASVQLEQDQSVLLDEKHIDAARLGLRLGPTFHHQRSLVHDEVVCAESKTCAPGTAMSEAQMHAAYTLNSKSKMLIIFQRQSSDDPSSYMFLCHAQLLHLTKTYHTV